MFHQMTVNNAQLLCVNYNGRWFFALANFCQIVFGNKDYYEYLVNSLQDYAKAVKTRRKQIFICNDVEKVATFIEQTSNKVEVRNKTLTSVDAQRWRQHCKQFDQHTEVIDLLFFCEYLRTMYQRWEQRRAALQLSLDEFCKHLHSLKSPCWAYLMEHLSLLEPFADHYLNGKPPKATVHFADATDDLLQYLESFREANCHNDEETDAFCDADTTPTCEQDITNSLVVYPTTVSATATTNAVTIVEPGNVMSIPRKKRRKISKQDRIAIAADQKWCCLWCRATLDECFEVDHIERFCETGNDHHSNLWALCSNCHAKKTELDRRRQKPAIWSNYRCLSAEEQESRQREIVNKITNI